MYTIERNPSVYYNFTGMAGEDFSTCKYTHCDTHTVYVTSLSWVSPDEVLLE